MRNLLLTAITIIMALPTAYLYAASLGDECKVPTSQSQYTCQFGQVCLKAIKKMYCSNLGKVCGWPGKNGYNLGTQKTYNGKKYECKTDGFKLVSSASSNSSSSNRSGIEITGVTTIPTSPQIRALTAAEKNLANSVFKNSINLSMVKVTNTIGLQDRPWTTNTPPVYTINVGVNAYQNLAASKGLRRLLIHELTHVWQGQHGIPFMSNSAAHQTMAAIQKGVSVYSFQPGKQWSQYNVEQQADIVKKWYNNGLNTSDVLYPYIRDNVRPGKPNAVTKLPKKILTPTFNKK